MSAPFSNQTDPALTAIPQINDDAAKQVLHIQLLEPTSSLVLVDQVLPLFQQYVAFYKWDHTLEESREFLTKRIAGGSKLFLACAQQSSKSVPVGFIHLYPQYSSVFMEENWVINDLYVAEAFRGGGLKAGTSLITHALEWADQAGAFHCEIGTRLDNAPAQYLYPKMGFVEFARFGDRIRYKYSFPRGKARKYPSYTPQQRPQADQNE